MHSHRHSPPRRWAVRTLAVLIVLLLAEGLLRGAFLLRLRFFSPPNCGVRPELLGRLVYAYSHDRPAPESDHQSGLVWDARRGYRLAPGMRQQEVHGARVSTDSRGIRGTQEYAVPKPDGTIRIVALGDSFTFGEGEPDDATWPAQLQRALPGVEVANLGAPAYAHDQMYFALVDSGLALQPDAVILGFYASDKWRDELTFYCAEKPRFSPRASGWHVENQPVPAPWETHDYYRRLPLLYALPRVLLEFLLQPALTDDSGDERAAEILGRIREATEAAGARFILVNLPDHPEGPPETRGFLSDYCARTGAECVDPWPDFRAAAGTDDPAVLRTRYQRPNDIHYSQAGYAVVAQALRRYLTEHPLLR
jgi:GDSL-like lipase/acylhydrolase family protein